MPEIDPSKAYLFIEDNGDRTCTFYLNLPKFKDLELVDTVVFDMPIEELLEMFQNVATSGGNIDDISEEVKERSTIVPNSPEDI